MATIPQQIELSHQARSWSVHVYPVKQHPGYVTGFFRPSDDGGHNALRRGVNWPSLGLVTPEEARHFSQAIDTASRIVEEMASVVKDGRVFVRVARRAGDTEVTLTTDGCEAYLQIKADRVVMVSKAGLGEFASLFHLWAYARIEEQAAYLRELSDEEIALIANPYEM